MPALLIINYDVIDAERLEAYREPAGAALVGPGKGTVIAVAHGSVDLGEGNGTGAHRRAGVPFRTRRPNGFRLG